jgi:hypothetical protein
MNVHSSIQNKKLELIQWLSTIDDVSVINKILNLKKKENKDWWNSISAEEKDSIELGLQDADSGKLNSAIKARKLYEKWL